MGQVEDLIFLGFEQVESGSLDAQNWGLDFRVIGAKVEGKLRGNFRSSLGLWVRFTLRVNAEGSMDF